MKPETMTARSIEAVDTSGRSEVVRHLESALPPRVIELSTFGNPRVTPRGT
jgi:polyphosphate kinase 2 (PPK2 family)